MPFAAEMDIKSSGSLKMSLILISDSIVCQYSVYGKNNHNVSKTISQ